MSLGSALRGEEKLWKVFWVYNVIWGLLLTVLLGVVAGAAVFFQKSAPTPLLLLIILLYSVFMCIALWRCAFNANWRVWGYLLRGLTVISVVGAAVQIYAESSGINTLPGSRVLLRPGAPLSDVESSGSKVSAAPPANNRAACVQLEKQYADSDKNASEAVRARHQEMIQACLTMH